MQWHGQHVEGTPSCVGWRAWKCMTSQNTTNLNADKVLSELLELLRPPQLKSWGCVQLLMCCQVQEAMHFMLLGTSVYRLEDVEAMVSVIATHINVAIL
eukprot:4281819-Amphidinium_carterae.1